MGVFGFFLISPSEHAMSYYFSKTLPVAFDAALACTTEALKREGFGIITEIDVKTTLKAKIGVDFRNYRAFWAPVIRSWLTKHC